MSKSIQMINTAEGYMQAWGLTQNGMSTIGPDSYTVHVSHLGDQNGTLVVTQPNSPQRKEELAYAAFNHSPATLSILMSDGNGAFLLERPTTDHDQMPLWQMALSGRDDEATRVVCDIAKELGQGRFDMPNVDGFNQFEFRSASLKSNMHAAASKGLSRHFQLALEISADLEATYPSVPQHGNLHHWNVVFTRERGWVSVNPQAILAPMPYAVANSLTNPYDPMPLLKMDPGFVLNRDRMARQIAVAAEELGCPTRDIARTAFMHAVQVASRRLYTTSDTQVALPYWQETARIAADVAGINLSPAVAPA